MREQTERDHADFDATGRRRALKGLAGVGAATVVWAEPSIKGLARRPAYAAPATGPSTVTLDVTVTVNDDPDGPTVPAMDPFGFGNLTIQSQINPNNGRPRFRLAASQAVAANAAVSISDSELAPGNTGPSGFWFNQNPNGAGWIRWRSGVKDSAPVTYTLAITFTCA